MSDRSQRPDECGATKSTGADELRTISFRLREIQRLLAARVEQENRRLEADGIEPVAEPRFGPGVEDRPDR